MLARTQVVAAFSVLLLAGGAAVAREKAETSTKRAVRGVPFEIKLPANPSAGYRWQVDGRASTGLNRISIKEAGTSAPPRRGRAPLVGAPVTQSWVVTPRQPGKVRLVFALSRPWEHKPAAETRVYRIDIAR